MSSLRKACANCTRSKRRCVVQKPKCIRCSRKNLRCVYDLEPLRAPPTESEKLLAFGFDRTSWGPLGLCIMKALEFRVADMDPAVCIPGHNRPLEITRIGFDTVPEIIRAGKPASFVHPKLRFAGVNNHFTTLVQNEPRGVGSENFKHLIRIDITTITLKEALTALQALLVHLAASFFSPVADERVVADATHNILFEWMQALLKCVDAGIPKTHSAWQDWLLGESKL